MKFRSTRGLEKDILSAKAIINGISKDGGLYVPDEFPKVYDELKKDTHIKYEDLAFKIINEYFTDIDDAELIGAINDAYNDRFSVKVKNNFLELYHGPTCAFKDAALLFLPQIMKRAKKICEVKEDITILTATSGDTGKAALEGFKNVEGFKVVVYYPKNGVSAIQERQMSSQEGNNVKVIGIKGNFDDAQTGVKEIFGDDDFRAGLAQKGFILSSANSINIGRLIPQIVYYFYGYFDLVNQGIIKKDDAINVVVPTGNFGNILAGYYAKQMGLPIDKFICASNENKVLTDFFETGVYDKKRELVLTESPSMDILVSSNLERLLFEASGRDTAVVSELMKDLNTKGIYEVNEKIKTFIEEFYGNFATTEEVYAAIKEVYEKDKYLMDTHTAVAYVVKEKYVRDTKDDKPALILSTASPFKFPRSICNALNIDVERLNDFKVLEELSKATDNKVPDSLSILENAEVLHDEVWDKNEMKNALLSYLNA
ncbi:threonine synthase [uncultured Clostridium sp.]|uniref:threonine synthase n=1 Tax=uncultured Clostridium sp. TaxID=59620 RepID=UPI0028ED6A39|nr:threonine synthase [uncultured Clostridium sp.]